MRQLVLVLRQLVLILLPFCLLGCDRGPAKGPVKLQATAPAAAPPTRDQMRARLMGKRPDEVKALLGAPGETTEFKDGKPEHWAYSEKTVNPANGKVDDLLSIWFNQETGVVDDVRF